MVTSIADLTPDGLVVYPGDYDDFLVEREARRELLEARARNQAKRIAEVERFIERFRYQATKARQVQSRIKALDKIERWSCRAPGAGSTSRFPSRRAPGRRVATLTDVHKAYGDNVVYAGVNVAVERGDRVALVGDERRRQVHPAQGPGRRAAVRARRAHARRPRGRALLRAASARRARRRRAPCSKSWRRWRRRRRTRGCAPSSARSCSRATRVEKKVAVLSGGEKARLALARMLVRPAALLCLDEPTNHLDLASREVLESALAGFPGTIVFISHDRYFINRIATVVVEVAQRHAHQLSRLLRRLPRRQGAGAQPAPASPTPSAGRWTASRASTAGRASPRPPRAGASGGRRRRGVGRWRCRARPRKVRVIRKRGTAEMRELKRRVEDLERQIHALEARHRRDRRRARPTRSCTSTAIACARCRAERKEAEERMSGCCASGRSWPPRWPA